MNLKPPFFLIALFILLFMPGCGTVFTHANSKKATTPACTGIYRGTQTDVAVVGHLECTGAHLYKQPAGWGLMLAGVFVACDVPLSAIADTFLCGPMTELHRLLLVGQSRKDLNDAA